MSHMHSQGLFLKRVQIQTCVLTSAMQNQSETSSDQRRDLIPDFLWFGFAAVRHCVATTTHDSLEPTGAWKQVGRGALVTLSGLQYHLVVCPT